MKKKVLIMAGYYVPSVKGGGPIQSIKNLVDNLSGKIDYYIVATDRDLGDEIPFDNIKTDEWVQVGKANVFYTDTTRLTWGKTAKIIKSVNYDVLYLNSFFSYKFSTVPVLLRKIKRIPQKPIIMAPRGQFSSGALGLKSGKKKQYLNIVKALGLYNNITWHATADTEKKDIELVFGNEVKITLANNLTANYKELNYDKNIEKKKGELKIVFISRVHPKKNLKKAIEFLKSIEGEIEFNIYGPLEDSVYWNECERAIKSLPTNIKVSYKGIANHDNVREIFKAHHVFLFPTLGENFGHVISEALTGGCPVIISDQTPWRQLEKKQVGWDIELTDSDKFISVLQYCIDLSNEEYSALSRKAFEYGKVISNSQDDVLSSYSLFE
ncbi:glycosyltransferase [Cytobacillus sp. S13-E01]|uniref:glycosyltransferase family 4 protein n=1 Tax=Cytobacillus sp. S13-E01 TaxID=3031326 RepID=UPI0023D8738C|nr:glycosyltransferase [Cytobacillus sp. S13-E01]MDF0727063.1 glycosyltransferase [Cytobacillus sp. S13-E01]